MTTELLDFRAPGLQKKIAAEILADIDAAAVALYSDGHRKHLGASLIGDPCYRKLWFTFRWGYNKPHDGRQLRLFNRGHLEEKRITEWLRHSKYIVHDVDPSTGEQWRVNAVGGHFGGSQDGEIYLPAKFNYTKPLLLEYKTSGTGAAFNKVVEHSVSVGKPVHMDQMDTYGAVKKYDYALYCMVNKNDDSMHVEIVKLDWLRGAKLEEKAKTIILSQVAPPRGAENPSAQMCNWCDMKDLCYYRQPMERNCRSCVNASPQDNKQWHCSKWQAMIPEDAIPNACPEWSSIYKP